MDRVGTHWVPRPLGRRSILKAGLAAAPALIGLPVFAAEPGPVVETRSGKLRGAAGPGVATFKGIPYAASTEGANRFRPPQPVKHWAGIRDAVEFGNSAPQAPANPSPLNAWYGTIRTVSEDCLSLNVFTPGLKGKRPVMVWLHGGAWSSCAGSAPGFDGTNLAKDGDVVVVTVNHRLNLFGYVRLDDKDERFADSGNAGLLDLVAALKWVRDDIASFGGDPHNVTIFGQSGGAAKVSAMLAMPAAKGLFHKAIAQSCSGSIRIAGEEEAARLTHGLAVKLGLDKADGAALQAAPAEQIIAALQSIPNAFRPVLDGRSFKRNPFEPGAPPTAANIPLIIGNAADEARLYMAADPKNFSLDAAEVHKRVARFLQIDAAVADRILDSYRANLPGPSPSDLLAAIATDFTYRRNTTHEAMLQSASAHAPVYAYVFDWKTPVMDGVLKTPHTCEVPFVFGTSEAAAPLVGTSPELPKLTKILISTWAAFAHAGNPNNATLPNWPRYDGTARSTMMIDLDSRIESNPGGAARQSLDPVPIYEYSMPINYVRA
ncbi:MAG TPA: carboxylesterase/lipase family protein [Aliidongia sp.]|nr:carboxylesterase/lipase family protein [Aliidongia sp.]